MTDLKTYAGRLSLGLARWSGSAALARRRTRPFGAVFTLHHVLPEAPGSFPPNGHLRVHPRFLKQLIDHLRQMDCDIVDLNEAVDRIESKEHGRFFACFTLDDGYCNNAEHAAPLFRSEGVPYAIFVAPGLSDGRALPWWEVAEAVVRHTKQIVLPWRADARLPSATAREKRDAFDAISIDLMEDGAEEAVDGRLRDLAARNGGLRLAQNTRVMSWADLEALAADPLATIGAHSVTHPRLSRLKPEAAFNEMKTSRDTIKERLGRAPNFFAYPYGSNGACGPREFEMARQLGFRASFTTRLHALTKASTTDLQALPRLSLNGYYQDVRYVEVLLSGLPGLWKERRA